MRAKDPRERERIVHAVRDRGVTSYRLIGVAIDGEDLSAGGGKARVGARPHAVERKETKQNKMYERDDQLLHQTIRLFARDSADERGATLLDEGREARERIGPRDAHIGIEEK